MENIGFYMMYVVEGIFVMSLLFAGIFSYKFPMNYQIAVDYLSPEGKYYTSILRYPHYSSKRALISKENWTFAQKTYGKWLLLFTPLQVLIGVFWKPIAECVIKITKWDEAGIIAILCPIFVFIILANVLTEVKLRRIDKEV